MFTPKIKSIGRSQYAKDDNADIIMPQDRWDTQPFTQPFPPPGKMSSFEKGIWLGFLVGIFLSNLFCLLLIK